MIVFFNNLFFVLGNKFTHSSSKNSYRYSKSYFTSFTTNDSPFKSPKKDVNTTTIFIAELAKGIIDNMCELEHSCTNVSNITNELKFVHDNLKDENNTKYENIAKAAVRGFLLNKETIEDLNNEIANEKSVTPFIESLKLLNKKLEEILSYIDSNRSSSDVIFLLKNFFQYYESNYERYIKNENNNIKFSSSSKKSYTSNKFYN